MTPLGTLIREYLDRRELSVRGLADKGGPPEATTRRLLHKDPAQNRNPPEDDALRRLADVLRIPLPRLYLAAAQTKGWVPVDPTPVDPAVRLIADALAGLDTRSASLLTDTLLSLAERMAALSASDKTAEQTAAAEVREAEATGQALLDQQAHGLAVVHPQPKDGRK